MISVNDALVYIGAIVVIKCLYDLTCFALFYASPPTVGRYLYGKTPYAIVTGATDGIGRAVAKELLRRGFNLVIHGRNPKKLQSVKEELESLLATSVGKRGDGTGREVKMWVQDAAADPEHIDFEGVVKGWEREGEAMEVTLVVHNVGGSPVRDARIDNVAVQDLTSTLRVNALFPLFFSRALLPLLRRARGPAGMLFVSSFAGTADLPRLIPYGASKAFVGRLSGCIAADERFGAGAFSSAAADATHPSNVETSCAVVGSVATAGHPVSRTLCSPGAEEYAKALVDRIGCGKKVVVPYVWHAVQFWFVSVLPVWVMDWFTASEMKEEVKMFSQVYNKKE